MEFRIGERDAATGLYQVIWPDGGMTLNGMKIFNAEHKVGDVVQATRRSDGMMILDGEKAVEQVKGLFGAVPGGKPDGYLRGQVWNDEEKIKKKGSYLILLDRVLAGFPSGSISAIEVRPLATPAFRNYVFYPGDVSTASFSGNIDILFFGGYLPEITCSSAEPFFMSGSKAKTVFLKDTLSGINGASGRGRGIEIKLDELPYDLHTKDTGFNTYGNLYSSELPPIFTIVKMTAFSNLYDFPPAKVFADLNLDTISTDVYNESLNKLNNQGIDIQFRPILSVPKIPFANDFSSSCTAGIAYFCVVDRINLTVRIS